MRIAFYEENNYHTEIMCLFIDFCRYKGYEMDCYNDADQSGFLAHYEVVFRTKEKEFRPNRYKNSQLLSKIKEYDYVVVGTLGCTTQIKDLLEPYQAKFIQIYHNGDDLAKSRTKIFGKIITVTPLNSKWGPYCLPIFARPSATAVVVAANDNHKLKPEQEQEPVMMPIESVVTRSLAGIIPMITVVGRFTNHRTVSSIIPILQMNYVVHIISRRKKYVPDKLVQISRVNPKLRISLRTSAQRMSEILAQSKYILCIAENDSWYYTDRLTGTIPLSFNYNVPIIIPVRLNTIYHIQGSIEYNDPNQIAELLMRCDDQKYNELLTSLELQRTQIVAKNRQELSKIFV